MTETKVTTLRMPDDLIEAIAEYQRVEGLRSWSYALIDLVNSRLKDLGYQTTEPRSWGGHVRKVDDGQR